MLMFFYINDIIKKYFFTRHVNMNKILISFLSLVMFINPNTSHSSEIGINHEEIVNTENYRLPNQVGYIHVLEDLQVRIDNINDLNLDILYISKTINVLKDDLIRNNNLFFNRFTVDYIRNNVIKKLNWSLNPAIEENKQEKAKIIEELIQVCRSIANDIESIEH